MTRKRRGSDETRWLVHWLRIVERLEPPPRPRRGHLDEYRSVAMMKACFVMTVKKIKRPQGIWNYLNNNRLIRQACGFGAKLPHCRTFQRRFRRMADELGDWTRRATEEAIRKGYVTARVAAADKSLHPARGPLWHQKHRRRNRVPKRLRGVDRDSQWGYSPYHKFVQGYAEHVIINATPGEARFPFDAVADTARMAENRVLRERLAYLPKPTRKILIDGTYDDNDLLGELQGRGVQPILPACAFRKAAPKSPLRQWAADLRRKKVNQRLYKRRRRSSNLISDSTSGALRTTSFGSTAFRTTVRTYPWSAS